MKINEPVFTASPDMVQVLLSYSGLATWIAEYGSGSKMDMSNPYLKDYDINPDRKSKGYAFLGRKKGDLVYAPDGSKPRVSSGKAYGRNLEWRLGKMKPFVPQPAQHLIELEIRAWVQEIVPQIQQLVKETIITKMKTGVKV